MELRFTSGQICKIFGITKQTLLFYDKSDIIKPKYIDESNGYRYYTLDQFDLLYLILSLRETGIPLGEIKNLLRQRTLDKTIIILENQIAAIQNKIENLQTAKNRLYKNLTQIEQIKKIKKHEFIIKAVPEQYLLSMPVQYINGVPDYDLTLSIITERMTNQLIPFYWDVGCIIERESFELGKEEMFVVLENSIEGEYVKRKPAGNYLCTCHHGIYGTLDNTYEKLFEYVKLNNLRLIGDVYEKYIINNLTTEDEKSYITEITVAIGNYDCEIDSGDNTR
ncbi:MerR family transcriptional regulator [Anaerosinus massiliensis]|uniref:MerR family transcriptional regulator n=1 Tax=Massilibacillus massiliensis TaxID=1806837 RepID=UPI000DA63525|nr:MerR family transcriptional regulator [Massilibacillus massiliensis]